MSPEKLSLPPRPSGLMPDTDEEPDDWNGTSIADLGPHASVKLWRAWNLWARWRNDARLIDIVNRDYKPQSNMRYLQEVIVHMLDALGKTLGHGDLLSEIQFLAACHSPPPGEINGASNDASGSETTCPGMEAAHSMDGPTG
jgi:hypothetical protein